MKYYRMSTTVAIKDTAINLIGNPLDPEFPTGLRNSRKMMGGGPNFLVRYIGHLVQTFKVFLLTLVIPLAVSLGDLPHRFYRWKIVGRCQGKGLTLYRKCCVSRPTRKYWLRWEELNFKHPPDNLLGPTVYSSVCRLNTKTYRLVPCLFFMSMYVAHSGVNPRKNYLYQVSLWIMTKQSMPWWEIMSRSRKLHAKFCKFA